LATRRILFVHQNFPGQFPHIVAALLNRGDKIAAIGGATARGRPGVDLRRWTNSHSSTPGIFPVAIRAEADLIRARAAALAAEQLKRDGFVPDIIIGHPGWGETLHLQSIFPDARMILLGEFYYLAEGGDVGFDREFEEPDLESAMRTTGKNATLALGLTMADLIVCPTPFQASTLPAIFQPRVRVLHEGIDLTRATRREGARLTLPGGRVLDARTPVITFINRNFERLRGFHIFMRALPALLEACPTVEIVLIGDEKSRGYGALPPGGGSWKEHMMGELAGRIDPDRLHFLGRVDHDVMIDALSIGAAHVYYTYPFVLSWSLVEAMACECLVLGSDTAPVRDAVVDGADGLLNDFFDVPALSAAMIRAVREPQAFQLLRAQARATAMARFDRATVGVPGWLALIDEVG
jgi:glycosyltransferase involved in cell wall biosynthesis